MIRSIYLFPNNGWVEFINGSVRCRQPIMIIAVVRIRIMADPGVILLSLDQEN